MVMNERQIGVEATVRQEGCLAQSKEDDDGGSFP
jgi:hypothetical protein